MSNAIQKTEQTEKQNLTRNLELLFKNNMPKLQSLLPKFLPAHRLLRIAISEISKNNGLLRCTPESILLSLLQCAQFGFEPGDALGKAYLIPFKQSCQFIMGYRGMLDLARRSGEILNISAHAVKEKDLFVCEYGLNEKLQHVIASGDSGEIVYFYALAKFKNGGYQLEVLTKQQVDAVRDSSKSYIFKENKKDTIWFKHYEEMGRKTAIRKLFKYLPMSVEMAMAVRIDEQAESGEPQDFLDGEFQIIKEHKTRSDEVADILQKKKTVKQQSSPDLMNTDTGEIIKNNADDFDQSWEDFKNQV